MKPLRRPTWDAGEDFDAILAVKRNPEAKRALSEAQPVVHSGVSRYRACAPHLEPFRGGRVSSKQKKALLACYEKKRQTAPCKRMLARVRELNPSPRCPLCGVDSAQTFDHYLPESLFPELAVCAYNLVPACYRCNTKRGDRWRVETERATLHPYYDWIPERVRLLEAEVLVSEDQPLAHFRVAAELDAPGFAGRFARHCHALGLLEHFELSAGPMLVDIIDDLRGQGFDFGRAQAELERSARARARRHGENHWEAALRRGAARSQAFIRHALAGGGT
jgi:5-methylcytosine-specific restriction endonuclease McrA